jgi:D-sedoheptulose 7-phosphate isomerase
VDFVEDLERSRRQHADLLDTFVESQGRHLQQLAEWCADTLLGGGKLLLFGNGGSAGQAQHLATEFVSRYDRPREAMAAIALSTDGAILTGIANDDAFARIFARQIEALGKPEDLALGISTSGASPNVILGLRTAREMGLRTAAMLGRDGGEARNEVALAVVVPGPETARIQEVQLFAGHILCRWVERLVMQDPAIRRVRPDELPISAES